MMARDMQQVNVGKDLAALEGLTVRQLRERYAEVFGEPTGSRHKDYLITSGGSRRSPTAGCRSGPRRGRRNW